MFDDINGNKGNDTIDGGSGGSDWLVGGQGDDSITAHSGGNLLYGNLGNDTLQGGNGQDILRGGQGDDVIVAGSGHAYISGDLGNDTETGGSGPDLFHGSQNIGIDEITNFNYAKGDRVELDPGTNVVSETQVGANTVIDMGGGNQMILQNVQLSSLPTDWLFFGTQSHLSARRPRAARAQIARGPRQSSFPQAAIRPIERPSPPGRKAGRLHFGRTARPSLREDRDHEH